MYPIEMMVMVSRFFKALALLSFLYVFAVECFYRLSPRFYEKTIKTCCFAILRFLNITVTVVSRASQPLNQNVIYICNHSSSFEIFIVPSLLNHTDFVMTAEALKVPFFKKIFRKCPLIFVERGSMAGRIQSFQKIKDHLKKGRNVMLFPEGYSHQFLAPRFEKGAFQIAFETGVPIVPIYLHYENLSVFVPDEVVSHKKEFFRILAAGNKKMTAYFFDPIQPETFSSADVLRDTVYRQYLAWQKEFYGR